MTRLVTKTVYYTWKPTPRGKKWEAIYTQIQDPTQHIYDKKYTKEESKGLNF